ncbi:MAG: phage tail family protein [Lachnospiraceae bacterium]|nr:phage tail family protein [Lachnospiraceae bacterium]
MYRFIDVMESQTGSALPSEALNFNGHWLEEEIPGYRTLHVSGREVIGTELSSSQIGTADGEKYRYKRYTPRTITVTYQLISKSNAAFREAYNKLNGLLDVEEGKLIFNDEQDKYFLGTKVNSGEVPPGSNSVTGEIEFICSDPFKYSVEEKEVIPSLDGGSTFVVDYKGTYPAHPIMEATFNSDNGFIAYMDERNHILQFGNVEEVDGEDYKANELLVTIQDFFKAPDDITRVDVMHPQYGSKGTLKKVNWNNTDFLAFGTKGDTVGSANGGLRTITIPADSSGKVGAKNFYSYFHVLFYAALMGQTGEMCINWLTKDDKMIAGVNWYKVDCTGNTGYYDLVANGRILKTYSYQTNHLQSQNPWYWDWGNCDLKKEGSKLTFFYYGGYPSFTVPEVEDMECAKIQIAMKQWGDRDGSRFMHWMGVDVFNFHKVNVDKWRDVPNKFGKGDTLSADSNTGDVTLKGLPQFGLGALGNDWEDFCLRPGLNQVKCLYSNWAQKPDFKLRYREVYL